MAYSRAPAAQERSALIERLQSGEREREKLMVDIAASRKAVDALQMKSAEALEKSMSERRAETTAKISMLEQQIANVQSTD